MGKELNHLNKTLNVFDDVIEDIKEKCIKIDWQLKQGWKAGTTRMEDQVS